MAAALWRMSEATPTTAGGAGTSQYVQFATGGGIVISGTESLRQVVQRTAGAVSAIQWSVPDNNRTTTSTARIRINGANGSLTIGFAGGVTGTVTSNSGSDSIAAGDLVAWQMNIGTGGSQLTVSELSCQFAATTDTATRFIDNTSGNGVGNNQSWGLAGTGGSSAQSAAQYVFPVAGTLKNAAMIVSTNTAGAASAATVINGSAGAISVSITGGVTGTFEDTTHTDTIAAGDLVNWSTSLTGGGSAVYTLSVDFINTAGQSILPTGSLGTVSSNQTRYNHTVGRLSPVTTESDVTKPVNIAATLSKLSVEISANTVTATSTISTRKNSGAGGQSIAISASTTGQFQDASGTDVIVASDTISIKVATGATGTSLSWRNSVIVTTVTTAQSFSQTGSGGATFTGSATRLAGRVQLSSGGINFGGVSGRLFGRSQTGSGSVTFGGTAPLLRTVSQSGAGGAAFNGVGDVIRVASMAGSGGIGWSGGALQPRGVVLVGLGGVDWGGVADSIRGAVYASLSGLSFGGAANITVSGASSIEMVGSGGVAFAGAADQLLSAILTSSGGLVWSGASVVLRGAVLDGSGGVVWGGLSDSVKGIAYVGEALFTFSGAAASEQHILTQGEGGIVWMGASLVQIERVYADMAGGIVFGGIADISQGEISEAVAQIRIPSDPTAIRVEAYEIIVVPEE